MDPRLETREGRLAVMHELRVFTDDELAIALRYDLDVTDAEEIARRLATEGTQPESKES